MAEDILKMTVKELSDKLTSGDLTSEEVVSTYLENAKTLNKELNAYVEIFDDALEEAREIDKKRQKGEELSPLAGIPIAIKDNILIDGKTCSASSKALERYKATYDATVISKLKKAGMIFLGRTNMDEFAMGGSTENSAFGVTKNPHDKERVAGGSSGGSAAVVGGGLAPVALGSDTGGSIRQPASFCGVVGLKPTYGAVSRSGLMAMASSLDQIGPLAKNLEDAQMILEVINGYDELDSTSVKDVIKKEENKDQNKFKIGVPFDFIKEGVEEEVLKVFNQTLDNFKEAGHEIIDISLPNLKYALPTYYVIMPAEVSSNMGRFDGLRYGLHKDGEDLLGDYELSRGEGFGTEVRRRIILGTYVLSAGYYDAYYGRATAVREKIREDYLKTFENEVDIIATPTAPAVAWKVGEKGDDPLQTYLEDVFTVPANLAGIPAISIPVGFSKEDLPIGVQLLANHFNEDILFKLGKVIEQNNQ